MESVGNVAAAVPSVRRIAADRPWEWLAAGWRDLRRAPAISLGYGLAFTLAGMLLTLAVARVRLWHLVVPLAAGFMLVGPILAVGLYEASRRLERGERVRPRDALCAWRRNAGQIGLLALALTLFLLAWVRLATLLFALFYGDSPPGLETFVRDVLFAPRAVQFFLLSTAIGAALAALVFAISAVSIPMLLDRDVDVVTAIGASLAAVRRNPESMAVWAGLIVLFVGAGLVTAYIGLILALPLIGHATWHAYRDLIA